MSPKSDAQAGVCVCVCVLNIQPHHSARVCVCVCVCVCVSSAQCHDARLPLRHEPEELNTGRPRQELFQ